MALRRIYNPLFEDGLDLVFSGNTNGTISGDTEAGNGLSKAGNTISLGDSNVNSDILLDNPSNSNQILIGSNDQFDNITKYATVIENYIPSGGLYGVYGNGGDTFINLDALTAIIYAINTQIGLEEDLINIFTSAPIGAGISRDFQEIRVEDNILGIYSKDQRGVSAGLGFNIVEDGRSLLELSNALSLLRTQSTALNFGEIRIDIDTAEFKVQDQEGRTSGLQIDTTGFNLSSSNSLNQDSRIVVTDTNGTRGIDFRAGDVKIFSGDIDSKDYELKMTQSGMIYSGQTNPSGIIYGGDYSANYTNRSLVDKGYVDTEISAAVATTEQEHVSGTTANINAGTTILYVDPSTSISGLTITMPPSPSNGDEVKISFGGTITNGLVAEALTIQGNGGDTILRGDLISEANGGDGYVFKYQSSKNLWRIF